MHQPQNIFFAKMNLCTCSKRIAAIFFVFLTHPAILQASNQAKNQASFVHDRVRRLSGSNFARSNIVRYPALFDCLATHVGRCSSNIFCSMKRWMEFALLLQPTILLDATMSQCFAARAMRVTLRAMRFMRARVRAIRVTVLT